jgi:hypothetical protein
MNIVNDYYIREQPTGNDDVFDYFQDEGGDNFVYKEMFDAVRENDFMKIDQYISLDIIDPNYQSVTGHTLLTFAVSILQVETVDILLGWSADPNKKSFGNTALDLVDSIFLYREPIGDELQRKNEIVVLLEQNGGLRTISNDSSVDSIPSNPDYDLMEQQMATQIQRIYRGRTIRQKLKNVGRNVGKREPTTNVQEVIRRYMEVMGQFHIDDPIHGYGHELIMKPQKKKTKKGGGWRRKTKNKSRRRRRR